MHPIEAPTLAQKHQAHIEQVALRLANGESLRQACAVFRGRGMSPDQVAELAPLAIEKARTILARNLRRDRIQGTVWLVCGVLPLAVFTGVWLVYQTWSLPLLVVTLALAMPALIQSARLLLRKPGSVPDLR